MQVANYNTTQVIKAHKLNFATMLYSVKQYFKNMHTEGEAVGWQLPCSETGQDPVFTL